MQQATARLWARGLHGEVVVESVHLLNMSRHAPPLPGVSDDVVEWVTHVTHMAPILVREPLGT